MKARWYENSTELFGGSVYSGGLFGICGSVNMARHDPQMCKPGFWSVGMNCGNETCDFFAISPRVSSAVVDNFGDLVKVPQ